MASRAQRTSKARARFGPIFFRSSVEMYRSENLLAEPTFSFFQRNLRLTLIDRPPPTFHVSEKKCLETLPTMFRTGFGTAGREPVTLWTFQNLGLTAKPKPRISMPFRGTITLFCLLLSSFGCIEKCWRQFANTRMFALNVNYMQMATITKPMFFVQEHVRQLHLSLKIQYVEFIRRIVFSTLCNIRPTIRQKPNIKK